MANSGAGLGKMLAAAESWRIPQLYRQPLDRSWLVSLVVAPLLVAGIGYAVLGPPPSADTPVTAPAEGVSTTTSSAPTASAPRLSLASFSLSRNGNDITVTGDLPDDSAKAVLMNVLKSSLPPALNVIDQTRINSGVKALDFANAGPVFTAGASIPDLNLAVSGDTLTFTGTAVSMDQKDAVAHAATNTWPGVNVVDKIEVKGSIPSSGNSAAGTCTNVQAAINAVTNGPITFGNDGVSLTPASNQALTQVAEQLKACPNARVTINGYTDNTGSEAVNVPLSMQRANAVADFLIAHGVAGDHVVARGLGAANPIAPNDTTEGRAKNRRAEIVVS